MRHYVAIGSPREIDTWRAGSGIAEALVTPVTRPGRVAHLINGMNPRHITFVSLRRGWVLTRADDDAIVLARCRGAGWRSGR